MPDSITIKAPVRCTGCGLKPGKTKGTFKNEPWLIIASGTAGVYFMACPKCYTVMVNSDAQANMKKAVEDAKRLIQPVSGRVPENFNPGRQEA